MANDEIVARVAVFCRTPERRSLARQRGRALQDAADDEEGLRHIEDPALRLLKAERCRLFVSPEPVEQHQTEEGGGVLPALGGF